MAKPTRNWLPWVILLVGLGGGLPLAWHIKEEYRTKSDEEEVDEPTSFLDLDNPEQANWANAWWPDTALRHPSIPRIIGMPVWQAYWLDFNLRHLNR